MNGPVSEEPAGADGRVRAGDPKAAAQATLVALVSRLAIAVLGWLGTVIVARTLSADAWGQFSFVFTLLALMAIFTDLGVGRIVLSRLIDGDPDEIAATASSFVALRVALGLFGYLFAVGYVVALSYPGQTVAATAVGGLVVVFATPGHAITVLFQSRHRLGLPAIAEILGQTIQLALTVAAAMLAPYLLVFVLAPVAKEIIALVIKIVGVRRRSIGVPMSRHIGVHLWRDMLRDAIPLAIGFALTMAMLKVNVLVLSQLKGFDAVGYYSVGSKFSDMMDTISVAAAGPVTTLLVAAWPADPAGFRQRTRTAANLFAVAGATAVAAFWPSAEQLVTLLYGDRFALSATAARLQVLGSAMLALIVLGVYLLATTGAHRRYPPVAAVGLAVNVATGLVLIPRMSFDGAAVAVVASLAITTVALWVVIARTVPVPGLLPLRALLILVAVTTLVVAGATQLAGHLPWPLVSALAALVVLGTGYLCHTRMVEPAPEAEAQL